MHFSHLKGEGKPEFGFTRKETTAYTQDKSLPPSSSTLYLEPKGRLQISANSSRDSQICYFRTLMVRTPSS